jgi:translation initiation factor RLI1
MKFFILKKVKSRNVEELSGGELQRFACAMVCIQKADIFMFDEPSSYLVRTYFKSTHQHHNFHFFNIFIHF